MTFIDAAIVAATLISSFGIALLAQKSTLRLMLKALNRPCSLQSFDSLLVGQASRPVGPFFHNL